VSWSDAYIGIPWRAGGRAGDGIAGLDCWGLLRQVYAIECGIELPGWGDVDALDGAAVAATIAGDIDFWRKVDAPREFDGVLLRKGRDLCHVGIVVRPGLMLHVDEGMPACLERLDSPAWRRRLAGYYRYYLN
jgi:probable lipoprotein NlpC